MSDCKFLMQLKCLKVNNHWCFTPMTHEATQWGPE